MSQSIISGACTCLLAALVLACGPPSSGRASNSEIERQEILPEGPPSEFFEPRAVGDPILGSERPQITNVQVADLDRDGLPDILVCDASKNRVSWIRQSPKGAYVEHA